MENEHRLCLASMCVALAFAGCGPGKHYEQGRAAEKRGEVHLAYDEYCLEAHKRPENKVLSTAIQRVAPTAATYWYALAKIAEAQGRTKDAVRMALRCLNIQPDHGAALKDVRALQGSDVSAFARTEQDHSGTGASVFTAPSVGPEEADARPQRDGQAELSSQPTIPAAAVVELPKPARSPLAASAEGAVAGPTLPTTLMPAPGTLPPPGEDGPLIVRESEAHNRQPKARRYAVDDVFIEVVKIDDTAVALDIYDGDRRIQEIRDLRIGRSKLFRSSSRMWYRLTVISAHQRTGNISIGIEPA